VIRPFTQENVRAYLDRQRDIYDEFCWACDRKFTDHDSFHIVSFGKYKKKLDGKSLDLVEIFFHNDCFTRLAGVDFTLKYDFNRE
jgi:hypothetical protein